VERGSETREEIREWRRGGKYFHIKKQTIREIALTFFVKLGLS
jgi:hypothetical protein